MLLIGQPISMLGFLFVVWGGTVASALRVLAASLAGRAAISVATLALISILTLIAVRAAGASSTARADLGLEKSAVATRVNRALPDLSLVDQRGDTLAWSAFRGRIVLLTFAYGHCETVCPLVVRDVLAARARLAASGPGAAVVVVTLDPWRDTPLRLGRIARQWGLGPHDRVLSGEVDQVLDALGKLGVSFTRDPTTGAVTHAPVVYVVDGSGRVDWVTNGGVDLIMELARQSGA
jgi:protein SCO1/2